MPKEQPSKLTRLGESNKSPIKLWDGKSSSVERLLADNMDLRWLKVAITGVSA